MTTHETTPVYHGAPWPYNSFFVPQLTGTLRPPCGLVKRFGNASAEKSVIVWSTGTAVRKKEYK